MKDLVAFVEDRQTAPLGYGVYFDESETQMTVVQVHANSASLERHMVVAGPAFPKFKDFVNLHEIDVYGEPSEHLRNLLRQKAEMLGNGMLVVHKLQTGRGIEAADLSRPP
ncbi:MAG: hypothetical protein GEU75_04030 [Dehalococcoidia bacterium]|nr:hypothetical protein [Dehalococcoidia bacterium]